MKSWAIYTGGRLGAVAARPLSLFLANNYLEPSASQALAIVFLANLLATIWVSADPHRRFLSRYFADRRFYNGLPFYLYVASLTLMMIAGSVIVLVGGLQFTDSVLVSLAAITYFVSERFSDEIQRVRIFERRLVTWGWMSIWRSTLQLGAFGALIVALGAATPASLVALVLAACNLVLFTPQLPKPFLANLRRLRFGTAKWLVRRAVLLLRSSWPIWLTAQLTAAFGYLDRGVALVVDKETLPLFMLVVMCFSIVQLTLDFYYLSRYRRDFLERRVSLRAAFTNREFLLSFWVGLVMGAIVCAAVLRYSKNGSEFPWSYVAVIAFLQTAVAISVVPREILYWSDQLRRIMNVEFVFWGLFACIAVGSWWLQAAPGQVFSLVVGCGALRLAHYLAAAARVAPNA